MKVVCSLSLLTFYNIKELNPEHNKTVVVHLEDCTVETKPVDINLSTDSIIDSEIISNELAPDSVKEVSSQRKQENWIPFSLQNFFLIVKTVQIKDVHLFSEMERQYFEQFFLLDLESQFLFVKLFYRKVCF
jgi:hypothetical protein